MTNPHRVETSLPAQLLTGFQTVSQPPLRLAPVRLIYRSWWLARILRLNSSGGLMLVLVRSLFFSCENWLEDFKGLASIFVGGKIQFGMLGSQPLFIQTRIASTQVITQPESRTLVLAEFVFDNI